MKDNFIVFNALSITSGGGLQKTLSLMDAFSEKEFSSDSYVWLIKSGTLLEDRARFLGLNYLLSPSSFAGRLFFEWRASFKFKGCICFNIGGPVMIRKIRGLNVSEVSIPKMLYPEVDFMRGLAFRKKIREILVQYYRRYSIRKSDFWIFQTEVMRNRAIKHALVPESRSTVVNVSPSEFFMRQISDNNFELELKKIACGRQVLALICGQQLHKNVHLVVEISKAMKSSGKTDFVFFITIESSSEFAASILAAAYNAGVSDHICFIGSSYGERLKSIYNVADVVCLYSSLESYCNNFHEAWSLGVPVISSDHDWSRCGGGDAVLYVDTDDIEDLSRKTMRLLSSPNERKTLAQRGFCQLNKLPTVHDKLEDYFGVFSLVKDLGPLCDKARKDLWKGN